MILLISSVKTTCVYVICFITTINTGKLLQPVSYQLSVTQWKYISKPQLNDIISIHSGATAWKDEIHKIWQLKISIYWVFFFPPSPSLKNTNLKQDIYEGRLFPSSIKSLDILPLISVVAGLQAIRIYPQNTNPSILLIRAFYYLFINATLRD